jgi:hypothetical protein
MVKPARKRAKMMGISFVKRSRKRARRPRTSVVCVVPHFCSMKITEDVRKYAIERGLTDAEALESGMQEKR